MRSFWRRFFLLPVLLVVGFSITQAEDTTLPIVNHDPVKLDPPDFHVKIKKELLGQHPRIFFTADELKAIKEKVNDPRLAAMRGWFIDDADRAAKLPVPPNVAAAIKLDIRGNENILAELAFAYLITGDAKYLAAWRGRAQAILSWSNWGDDLGVGHLCFGLSISYDWLYHDLSPDERKQIETEVLLHGRNLLRDPVTHQPAWWNTSYFQNHCWINHTGISTAAMALYDVYPDEMQTWLDDSRTIFQQTYQNIGLDGGYHEGASYARYGTTWMLYYVDSLRHTTGENLFDMPFLTKVGGYFCQTVMPDGANLANFGDCPPISWNHPIEDQILVKLAAEYHDGHMMELRDRNRAFYTRKITGEGPYESPFALIWVDPSIAPKPLDDLPLVGLFADLGLVVTRTSWKADAAAIALHCGAPGGQHLVLDTLKLKKATPNNGHTHPDANSFVFWADHAWRIGLPGAYTYIKATHNENTWEVDGKGQRGDGLIWFEQKSYMSRPDQAHLVTVATTPEADYVVGEAAPAYYDEVGLTQFTRHLLFVKGGHPYVVVYDQLAAKSPQTWVSYLHTFTKTTVTDGTFQIEPSAPGGTPSYGAVFGPGKIGLTTHALMVLTEHTKQAAPHGFELAAAPEGASDSTWLITEVGIDQKQCALVKPGLTPEIKVGTDDIAWNSAGGVSLNGKPIAGNLLPQNSASLTRGDDDPSMLAGEPPAASAPAETPTGDELITNSGFDAALDSWEPQKLQGAEASFEVVGIENGKHAIHITVPTAAEKRYYVQLLHGIYTPLRAGKKYTFSFRAKSKPGSSIVVFLNSSDKNVGEMLRQDNIALAEDWKDYSYSFTPQADSAISHLTISGFAAQAGEYWLTNVSLREGGNGTTPTAPALSGDTTPVTLPGAASFTYRDGTPEPMRLHVFKPEGWKATDHRPALVFYFGGGWTHGNPASAMDFTRGAAARGMVGIAPDYRTETRFGTSPLESVADARASFRWVQDHAAELGIDPTKIVVGGHSAGGHVALWTAIDHTPPGSDPNEAPHAKPAALFLLAPVSDTSATGYTPFRFGANALALSPVHQLDGKMPPTLLMHADTDEVVPYRESVALASAIEKTGAVCEFVTVPHGNHGFPWQHNGYDTNTIMDRLVEFLKKNGVMSESPEAKPSP
jgi:acetyl esterase